MTNKLKFGILGCGMIANFHAEAIKSLDSAVLYGVADNDFGRTQSFAEKYSIKAYKSYECSHNISCHKFSSLLFCHILF